MRRKRIGGGEGGRGRGPIEDEEEEEEEENQQRRGGGGRELA